ncbi:MAG: hypothetical protein LUE61_08290 [Clostridiales bacterium]|nr:hypothetical protein [Clostridiales bacterium]
MIHIFGNMKTKDRWLALLCVLLVCGQVYFDLRLPDYTAEITVLISSEVTGLSQYFVAGGEYAGLRPVQRSADGGGGLSGGHDRGGLLL